MQAEKLYIGILNHLNLSFSQPTYKMLTLNFKHIYASKIRAHAPLGAMRALAGGINIFRVWQRYMSISTSSSRVIEWCTILSSQ